MSKNIVDGVLVETSPSMITAFDAETTFGCERKGWFKYVMGLPEPQTGNQELGEKLHELIEQRLKTGNTPVVEHDAAGLYLAGQAMIEEVANRTLIGIERELPLFHIAGVKLKGYCDVVTFDGIIDWKTSSDIRRYGKTAKDLAVDTQMVLYAKAFHSDRPTVKLAHGQFQTKGRKSTDFVEVEVTQEHLDSHISKVIIPKVERMKLVASMTSAEDAVPDRKKCFNCAFRARCPTEESKSIMGFFDKIRTNTTQSATPPPKTEPEVAQVKPPDAPPSQPEKAAEPVAGFSATPPSRKMLIVDVKEEKPVTKDQVVEALVLAQPTQEQVKAAAAKETIEKRGRGRPPGAKNKPKTEEITYPPGSMAEAAAKEQAEASRQFKSITITKGATINVGNFNSVRFDVSVTSEEHTYEEVYAEVSRRLDEEAAKYDAEMAKGSSVPANGVVSK